MSSSFGENVDPCAAVRAILGSYPFSVGLLRELLQNSDDARASKQIFVLDHRTHATDHIHHPRLKPTQGPALLAFNDAMFQEEDWEALQNIHRSSKKMDTSKIGKYGIGFRSVYHITDYPQIMSGPYLAILDPQHNFARSGGVKIELSANPSTYQGHLTTFDSLLPSDWQGKEFTGSVVRLPLRNRESEISNKVVGSHEISQLLHDFIKDEINIALLFLENVKTIEIYEINERGKKTQIAVSAISRSLPAVASQGFKTHTASITTTTQRGDNTKVWRLLRCPFPQEDAISLLAQRTGFDPSLTLSDNKLLPDVSTAIPLSIADHTETSGRLFTFLPLPMKTGFPGHIHALFALTQSRQNLRNSEDTGIVRGSNDSILVEWNKVLFQDFIPKAWARLLEVLTTDDHLTEVFLTWPPSQPEATCGDSLAWRTFPSSVFQQVVSSKLAVWPVYGASAFKPLESVLVAPPAIKEEIVAALSSVGLEITRPPGYIVDIIIIAQEHSKVILTPKVAHTTLLKHVNGLESSSLADTTAILEYLLSTGDISNIGNLPVVPVVGGRKIALVPTHSKTLSRHTLLERLEYDVFGACDDNAIALAGLPKAVAELLREHGPCHLNVERLTSEKVIKYLDLHPNRLGLNLSTVEIDALAVKWLSAFWVWFNESALKDELFPKLRRVYLLPCTAGLKTAERPVFQMVGEHPNLVQDLMTFGVPFLHSTCAVPAQNVLANYGLLKKINNIHALLENLSSRSYEALALDETKAQLLLNHIASCLPASCSSNGRLSREMQRTLRSLPVFCLVTTDGHNITAQWTHIPIGSTVRGIVSTSSRAILPRIAHTVYIDLSNGPRQILPYLEPDQPDPMTHDQLLSLAVEHLGQQPQRLQATILKHIIDQRHSTPPSILQKLRQSSFVYTIDSSTHAPDDVIDPSSSLVALFPGSNDRLARRSNNVEKLIVEYLSSLGLLQSSLTGDIIKDRIQYVSRHTAPLIAKALLRAIRSSSFNCRSIDFDPQARWLPTAQGLLNSSECRPCSALEDEMSLFDEILHVLEYEITVSPSLQAALGWDRPILFDILIKQLDRVLTKNMTRKVTPIIRELSKRKLSVNDLNALREVTSNRGWIPQSGQPNVLISTADAVISHPIKKAGFYQISSTLLDRREVEDFLRMMGCPDKPSPGAILGKLNALCGHPPTEQTVSASISLLKALPPNLDEEQRSKIFVPDINMVLRPVSNVYFNDIGDRSVLVSAGADMFHAHPRMDESLCRDLKMGRLGLKFVHLQTPGEDMGEKPITTVCRTLGQYTKKQLLPEFLANACDAKATVFSVLLNEPHGSTTKLLSSSMAKFYDCSSLLIYNDSTFSEKDFEGICRTNVGGKKDRSDTIGQFGLGALTMFHLTELAIIISGNDILFLNPSRGHLPMKDRAALKMPLSHVRKLYPDHLTPLEGLFGFNIVDTGSFPGTIFMLPLRKSSHYEGFEYVSPEPWNPEKVRREIIEDFKTIAADCLLFTEIVGISASSRNGGGIREEWSINAAREPPLLEGNIRYGKLTISHLPATALRNPRTWQVATQAIAVDSLPHEISSVSKRQPIIGLAVSLDNNHEHGRDSHRFFSTLPLPTSTSLPVHVTASFVLSSDRRNIRIDGYDTLETKYNKWLLSTALPPLYLFLLAKLSCIGDNKRHWPGKTADDNISQFVTSTFYSTHLKTCKLPVFRSKFYPFPVYPGQAVISGNEPDAVTQVLELIKPHDTVKLSAVVRSRVIKDAGISAVAPQYVKAQILSDPLKLTSMLKVKEISNVVRFLVQDGVEAIVGLKILPLEDGTFGTFMPKSNSTSYYVWKKSYGPLIFPPNRIVNSEFHPKDLQILNSDVDLNIASLNSTNLSALARELLPGGEEMMITTQPPLDFITSFWDAYPRLGMNVTDIDLLPLVATMETGRFVSLSYCRSKPVVLSSEDLSLSWLWDLLQQLGILTVRKDHLPRALKAILEGKDYSTFNLNKLLSIMEPFISQVVERILSLDEQVQHQFALWLRLKLSYQKPPQNLINVTRSLPIWPAACKNQPERLCAASQVLQLPSRLTLQVARFMRVLVSQEPTLKLLNAESISYLHLDSKLDLPEVLGVNDEETYKALLTAWVNGLPASDTQPLPVPNCNLVVQLSNTLYARDPLFEAAFGPGSPSFVHSRFRDLEVDLHRHGLQRQNNLTMPIFADCARALQSSQDDADKTARAAVVFASYSQDLPLHIGSAQQHLWHTVDNIRFIPRKMNVIRELQYVQHLPEVVSPNQLVREEFEHIAWSQRAFFNEQPDQRVLLAYPGLGKPTVSDVVTHLQILSKLTESETLLRDVTETYKFLNDNAEAARNVVLQHHDEKIFLNVDDPSKDKWTWEAADNLAFSTHDIEEVQRVRHFLTPFKDLLLSAGVVPVYQPPVADASPLTSDSVLLLQIRTGFNEMRKAKQFIDVVFIPSSGPQLGEGEIDPELVAHRNFLAVYSDYFRDAFCGDYKEALAASSSDPIRFPVDYPKPCIAAVLDYIYSGTFLLADLPDEETFLALDDLLDIMKLSEYWRLTGLFEIVQREIATKGLIDPTTLAQTSEVASSIGATLLLNYCTEYQSHNVEYIRKVRG